MNSTTTIRASEPADAPAYAKLMGESSAIAGMLRSPLRPVGEAATMMTDRFGDPAMTMLTAEVNGEFAGYAEIRLSPSPRRRHVGEIVVVVSERFQGQGIGSALMSKLVDLGDNWLQLRRLELEVNVDNDAAIHLYRKCGFEIEATKRGDAFRDGRYIDGHVMGRTCR